MTRGSIRHDLAELLGGWLAHKPQDAPPWPGRWHEKAARMIRANLRLARARWIVATPDRQERRERWQSDTLAVVDDSGIVVDFHALRATYVTLLVKAGGSVKAAQELARHSDPKLTMNTYAKLGVHDLAGASDSLPGLKDDRPDRPERQGQRTKNRCAAGVFEENRCRNGWLHADAPP